MTDLFGLRPYQQQAVSDIENAWATGIRSVCYQLPTGGGKSRILRSIVDNHAASRKVIYIIAHRNTLVSQLSNEIAQAGIRHGIIQAGAPYIKYRVQVCSMQTLVRRLDKMAEPEIVVVDEFHHAKSASYLRILNTWSNAKILGVTATPQRPDGKGLSDIVDRLILGPTVKQLMNDGFLCDYDYYAPETVSMEGVRMVGGDYDQGQAVERVDKKIITGNAVEHYKRYADHKPAIACCVNIAHSEHVAEEFRQAGYKAMAVNSRLEIRDVARALKGLKDGTLDIVTQCEMLGEGVDVPAATCLIGLRPTGSLVIFLQHIGRVLRKAPDKDKAIILDHVGNWTRFGLPDDERQWSLEGRSKKPTEASAYKRCPDCLRAVKSSVRKCPFCNYEWQAPQTELPQVADGELVSIRDRPIEETQELVRAISRKAHNLKQAIAIAKEMGYKHTSAFSIWTKELHLHIDSVI
jgi:superfamily II DNA or RNA helicase